jgi:hypothetical protein
VLEVLLAWRNDIWAYANNKKNYWFTSQRKPITINSFFHSPHIAVDLFPLGTTTPVCRDTIWICVYLAEIYKFIGSRSATHDVPRAESSLSKARNMYSGEHYMIQISGTQLGWMVARRLKLWPSEAASRIGRQLFASWFITAASAGVTTPSLYARKAKNMCVHTFIFLSLALRCSTYIQRAACARNSKML